MPDNMINDFELMQFLDNNTFIYRRIDHAPVYTCAEADRLFLGFSAVGTKNLFLCDKKARLFYLVVTSCEKDMNIRHLAKRLGVSKLRFASEDNLGRLLGVVRGAVTMLGLVNDANHEVELWIDTDVWKHKNFLCHPLVNTATLVLSKESLSRFFEMSGHAIHLLKEN